MQPIVCRVNPRLWWMVSLATLEAGFMFVAPYFIIRDAIQPVSLWGIAFLLLLAWGMGSLFGWSALWLRTELRRSEIRADENGVMWRRGFADWKSARWEEIRDFYLKTGKHIVETDNGKLELNKTFVGVDAIIEIVPHRAVNAKAREWEMRDYRRDENWEQTLPVWTKSQIWTAPVISAALIFSVGGLFVLSLLEPRSQRPAIGFFWDSLFPLIAFVFLAGPLAGLLGWAMFSMWCERKFAWNHRDEKLHLNASGIVFESANNRVEASWDEIQRVERLPRENRFERIRVVTRNGNFVLWRLMNSEMLNLFCARCQSYAPAAIEHLNRQLEAESSFDSEFNPAPVADDGAQTFSFRTRGNRLILGTIGLVLVLAPFFYLINVYNSTVDRSFAPSWLLFWALCALAVLICGVFYLWFARARIVATADALQLHWPLRAPRIVSWNEIESAGADAWGNWIRVGGRKIYWALVLFPARREEIRALIEKRGRADT